MSKNDQVWRLAMAAVVVGFVVSVCVTVGVRVQAGETSPGVVWAGVGLGLLLGPGVGFVARRVRVWQLRRAIRAAGRRAQA